MKRAFIFANGRMDQPPPLLAHLLLNDLIIAADGGTLHCKSLGIIPNVIIGDFDSLEIIDISTFQRSGIEVKQYPTHKDETDLELALQLAVERLAKVVFIIGALGDRWDMTIANVLLSANPMYSHTEIHLLDGLIDLTILHGDGQINLDGQSGSTISLIPIAGDVLGVTTFGLEYPLNNETLYFGTTRGVSNVFLESRATISVKEGSLLICLTNLSSM